MKNQIKKRKNLKVWPLQVLGSVVALIGFSSIVYSTGFLVLRSHDAMFGLWGGITHDSSVIFDEGGRFLLHTYFLVLELFSWRSVHGNLLFSFSSLLIVALAVSLPIYTRKFTFLNNTRGVRVYVAAVALYGFVVFVLAWLLLEALAVLLSMRGILTSSQCVSDSAILILSDPADTYGSLFRRFIVLIACFFLFIRLSNIKEKLVTKAMQYVLFGLIIGATLLLPAAYGRLVYLPEYPIVKIADLPDEDRIFLRASGSYFMFWNRRLNNIELVAENISTVVEFVDSLSLLEIFRHNLNDLDKQSAKKICP